MIKRLLARWTEYNDWCNAYCREIALQRDKERAEYLMLRGMLQ